MLNKKEFQALADFRYQMRKFERFSELAAMKEGIKPHQYLLMLQIKGINGRDWATVGELADRLQVQQHATVALVSRCETLGLVERRQSEVDRRQVQVHLLPLGELMLERLATLHRAELKSLKGVFEVPQMDF